MYVQLLLLPHQVQKPLQDDTVQLQRALKVLGQTVQFDLDLGRRCLLGKLKIELAAAFLNLSPSPRERLCFDKNRAELIAATTFLEKEGKAPQPPSFGNSAAFCQLPAEIQFARMHANTRCLAAEDLSFPLLSPSPCLRYLLLLDALPSQLTFKAFCPRPSF